MPDRTIEDIWSHTDVLIILFIVIKLQTNIQYNYTDKLVTQILKDANSSFSELQDTDFK